MARKGRASPREEDEIEEKNIPSPTQNPREKRQPGGRAKGNRQPGGRGKARVGKAGLGQEEKEG